MFGLVRLIFRARCRECDVAWIMDPQLPDSPTFPVSESRERNKSDVRTRKTPRRLDEGPKESSVEQQRQGVKKRKRLGHDSRWLARPPPHVARLQLRF